MSQKKKSKGRGTHLQPQNRFETNSYGQFDNDGIDEYTTPQQSTEVILKKVKSIVNEVKSPDVPMQWSLNPYQGCEHGCIYCYARNSHEYWGYNSGIDFERKIIAKENAPELLLEFISRKSWKPAPIVLSGNTDCYQPVERKHQLTRQILEIFLRYKHPTGIITKNALITRDLDLMGELADLNLIAVNFSFTSLDENVRRFLEPRTSSVQNKLLAIEKMATRGIPVHVIIGPVIMGLNDHEIPSILAKVAQAGARGASYITLRLNGHNDTLFIDWLSENFPDKKNKVLHGIESTHQGKLKDNTFHTRMKGTGKMADVVKQLFHLHHKKYFQSKDKTSINELDTSLFIRPHHNQLNLF